MKNIEPFLKWAGGKRWLVNRHEELFPSGFQRYIEPFLGSGAVYFSLKPKRAILSDINSELIETYHAIREHGDKLYLLLKKHQRQHSNEYYYYMRASSPRSLCGRAARFIYLNRTCWNGLYRVNQQGHFNVPIGTRSSVLLGTDNFKFTSKLLKNAKLYTKDFGDVIKQAKVDDLIFVDPPYTIQHNYNNFIKYNEKLFSWLDQVRLRDCLISAHDRGAKILLTNANHPAVVGLYSETKIFNLTPVNRTSAISSKSSSRGDTSELIIRNYE